SLHQKLCIEGFSEEFFFPVYTKRKQIVGYELDSEHLIVSGSFVDGNYGMGKVCPKCRKKNYSLIKNQYHYVSKMISRKEAAKLEAVNYTEDTFQGERSLLINKDLYNAIKKINKQNLEFLPVFIAD
ncbi:MAG: hypothetical protein Q4F21_08205, partial [Lachnospiraceae bacterium]|nr:hypothetical protein [Lachnospiraceae bacterium]